MCELKMENIEYQWHKSGHAGHGLVNGGTASIGEGILGFNQCKEGFGKG